MNDNNTYNCPKCNNEVNINSRCCMKCGYLNPYHVQNVKYEKYMNNDVSSYSVSDGNIVEPNTVNQNSKAVETALSNHTGNFTVCFIINLLFYILLIGFIVAYYFNNSGGSFIDMISSNMYVVLFEVTLFSLFVYSRQLIFMKMNKNWLLALIPFVNSYMLSYAITDNKLLSILVFVPGINSIYYVYLLFKLGKSFNKSGFLTVLLPFIMFPVIGFGGSSFNGVCYVDNSDSLESEFKKKKIFFRLTMFIFLCCILMAIYANVIHIDHGVDKLSRDYMYYAAQKVMNGTKNHVERDFYTCDEKTAVFYFHFNDLSEDFSIPFYVFRDSIEGYVKVVDADPDSLTGHYEYYISLTDGTYGFAETKFDELNASSIVPYTILQLDESVNNCYFN